MSKTITSPVKRWSGTVTISDPMTLPQAEAFEAGLILPDKIDENGKIFLTALDKPQVPAILACVEKWELADFPNPVAVENFPFSPRKDSHDLIEWMFSEIRKIYLGESDVPNE